MKSICIALIGLLVYAFTSKDPLTGTWQRLGPDNRQVIFREDSTFDMLVNETPRVSGRYRLQGDLLTVNDFACADIKGIYKLIFFGNGDSCRFEAINDDCGQRRQQSHRSVLYRVK